MRLIDAGAVSAAIENHMYAELSYDASCYNDGIDDALGEIEDAETVDAVPVVRCKDCVYYDKNDFSYFCNGYRCSYWCGYHNGYTESDDFCSHAEKKEDTDGRENKCPNS